FARIAAGRYRPDHITQVGDVDVVVDHHHELAPIGAGAGARGNQQRLLGMARIGLADRHHGERPALRAIDEAPDALYLGDAGALELVPQHGGAERQRDEIVGRLERRRAEHDWVVAVVDALDLHHRHFTDGRVGVVAGPLAERAFLRRLAVVVGRDL